MLWLNNLRAQVVANKPLAGIGIMIDEQSDGVVISALARSAGTAAATFEVVLDESGSSPRVYVKHGLLHLSLRPGNVYSPITNLCPANPTEAQIQACKLSIVSDDIVFLEIEVDDGLNVVSAEIKTRGSGGVFDINDDIFASGKKPYIELESGKQKRARKIIATIEEEDGSLRVRQAVTRHLLLRRMCVLGIPVVYPIQWEGSKP